MHCDIVERVLDPPLARVLDPPLAPAGDTPLAPGMKSTQ